MIPFEKRLFDLAALGRIIQQKATYFSKLPQSNPWFTTDNALHALKTWANNLTDKNLNIWCSKYPDLKQNRQIKTIGIIMAGNIPMVGFHDLLCGLISGNRIIGKISSKDSVLIPAICQELFSLNPNWHDYINFDHPAEKFDAIIATGSDNTILHLSSQNQEIPAIMRGNRNSLAVLQGNESEDELLGLARDMCTYFGLGCRSISMILAMNPVSIEAFANKLSTWAEAGILPKNSSHPPFSENLHYQRAILKVAKKPFIDSGELLFVEEDKIGSPIGIIHYKLISDTEEMQKYMMTNSSKIQCLVAKQPESTQSIPFGKSQMPELWDYADRIDTLDFLINLRNEQHSN